MFKNDVGWLVLIVFVLWWSSRRRGGAGFGADFRIGVIDGGTDTVERGIDLSIDFGPIGGSPCGCGG